MYLTLMSNGVADAAFLAPLGASKALRRKLLGPNK
jgi:hypothetical protein